jgi:hypothetical protein
MTAQFYLKDDWRRRTLACIASAKSQWKKGKLDYAYLELFGRSGFAMYDLLRDHLPHKGGRTEHFIGIDHRPEVLLDAVLDRTPNFPLYFGDAFADVPLLFKQGRRIGTVMLDTTNGARPSWWQGKRESLRSIASEGTRVCPTFLLMLNHTLTRGHEKGTSLSERIRAHADSVAATFNLWGLEARSLTEGLAEGLAALPLARGAFTEAGAFDIYRSEDHTLYMMTVRLVFDARMGRAYGYRFSKQEGNV